MGQPHRIVAFSIGVAVAALEIAYRGQGLGFGWGQILGWLAVACTLYGTLAALLLGPVCRHLPRRIRWLGPFCVFGALFALYPARPSQGDQPSVLLVTIDTLRADHLSAYGSEYSTPNLDALATAGVLFEQATSVASMTEPAHLSMLTGTPPYLTGVVSNGTHIGDRPDLLSHRLRERGYRTAAFVSAHPLHRGFGWDQGFDVFDDDFGLLPQVGPLFLLDLLDPWVRKPHARRERKGQHTTIRATGWLRRQKGPVFAWVHLFDPHGPYEAPDGPQDAPTTGTALSLPTYWPDDHRQTTSEAWIAQAYAAEVQLTDALVGQLVEGFEGLVVVVADHGEGFTEHLPIFDHGDNLFDPSLMVPWIMQFRGVIPPGIRVPCQVPNSAVAPTVLGLLGAPSTGSLHTMISQGAPCDDIPVLSSTVSVRDDPTPPVDHAWRVPGRKLLLTPKQARCYDLNADPGEQQPVPTGCEDLAEALSTALDSQVPSSPITQTEALKALGYLE